MQQINDVSEDYNLSNSIDNIATYYDFFDNIAEHFVGAKGITIRQVVNSDELLDLSTARKRMYDKRDDYFSSLYSGKYYLEPGDYQSYLFACFYEGEIIALQRATDRDYEISQHVDEQALSDYLGEDFSGKFLEFSRLVVDKDTPLNGVANAISFVAGSMIALATEYDDYMTYSKPKLRRKSLDLDKKPLRFTIDKRNNNHYELYKGSVINDISLVFSVAGTSRQDIINNFKSTILDSAGQTAC